MDTITWQATYNDNAVLKQFTGKRVNRYEDIERVNLKFFDLMKDNKVFLRIHFDDPRKRLIYRRRAVMGQGGVVKVYFLAGWQMTVGKENLQVINYVDEDGLIFSSSGWKEPYGKPELYQYEMK